MKHASRLLGTFAVGGMLLSLGCSGNSSSQDPIGQDHLQSGLSAPLMEKLPSGENLMQFRLVLSRVTLTARLEPLIRSGAEQGSIVEFDQVAELEIIHRWVTGVASRSQHTKTIL